MPKGKRYKFKTRFRTASKVQEKQLVNTAKWLAGHPDVLIPKCESECARCDFTKLAMKIRRVAEFKDAPQVLKRFARRGDQLVRAYAAILLIASKEKARYLGVAKGPDGEIAFMQSPDSKAQKEKLIALQYFRDPRLRLMAYGDISRKKKLTFFSTKDELYCAPQGGKPPKKFVDETLRRLLFSMSDSSHATCGHIQEDSGYIEIEWKVSKIFIRLCESCLKETQNTVSKISERMIDLQLSSSFNIRAKVKMNCDVKCDDCTAGELYDFDSDDTNKYLNGRMSDRKLYDTALENFLDSIREGKDRLLIIGRKCYGKDDDSFVKSIAGNELEMRVIEILLDHIRGPIVLPDGSTVNKFLAQNWDELGGEIVKKLTGSATEQKIILSENETPMALIEKALADQRAGVVQDSLPRYKRLGTYSSFVNKVARKYKIYGREAALKMLELSGTEDTRQKSIRLAFSLALGEFGKEWQHTPEEVEYAKHLSADAKKLLESEGDTYDSTLREFMSSAGVTEDIIKKE